MPELLRMPEVAAGATHAILSAWPHPVNAAYTATTVIAIIETDKAVVDVQGEHDGVIVRTLVDEGAEVAIGDPIALIAGPAEVLGDVDAALAVLMDAAPATPLPDVDTALPDPLPSQASPRRTFASPLARRMAKERGLDLSALHGTGPNGRIRRRDIESATSTATSVPGPIAPRPAEVNVAFQPSTVSVTEIPHSRLRKTIAARLTASVNTAPHFYLRGSARVDGLMRLRAELNGADEIRVSVNDLVIKAVARAHMLVPDVNVIWTDEAILRMGTVDISVAIATENGLVTPVLRSVETLSISQVARATQDFAARARAGQLRQHELEGGSSSVTNLGMFGTEDFSAIINPPQSSILAVGAARPEPVVEDGQLVVGTVMHMTMSVDHRPIDGAVAAAWMRTLVALLERPARILA